MRTVWLAMIVLTSRAAMAQEAPDHATALAKRLQNRVSDLVSIPLQFNFNSGGGLGAQTWFELRVQPFIPIHLTPDWRLISRTIIPFLSLPTADGVRESGLGDIEEELMFSPVSDSHFTWGLGPRLSFPTATIASIVTGSWAAGPVGVASWVGGPWVVGALASVDYTFAHSGHGPDLGSVLVQPLVNFNLGSGWSVLTTPMIAAHWVGDREPRWIVPVGGGVAWTTKIGERPISLSIQYYYNVVRPDDDTTNLLRFVVTFLFPTATAKDR